MQERRIHQLFEASVLLKGLHGVSECIGGVALGVTKNSWMRQLVTRLTQSELAEDKRDLIATHLVGWAQLGNSDRNRAGILRPAADLTGSGE